MCCTFDVQWFLSQVFAVQTTKLEGVEVNSVGDNISESGIDEGILSKRVAAGPLADKKVIDMPYKVNTISKEVLDNQGVKGFEDAVRYFPSAQIQYRGGGGDVGRPQTRGFQGSVVGNVLWDGFYASSTTAIPMAMFESLQIQNGLAGSLYGGQYPAGIFSYSRKHPVADYNAIWTNYISRGNLGVGFDTSNKFEKIGYRGVFYYTDGEREPKDSKTSRRLASIGLDFYPTDDLTFETNFSYYKHTMGGYYNGVSFASKDGIYQGYSPVRRRGEIIGVKYHGMPSFSDVTTETNGERFMRTITASGKFKYAPTDRWYLEGGYQWQKAIRSRNGDSVFTVPSAFLKAQTDFNTGSIKHNFATELNGYRWSSEKKKSLLTDMKNISVVDDIALNDSLNVILSASNTWFKKTDYKKDGISWAGSVIYKVMPDLNVYFTYADSLKDGASKTYEKPGYDITHPLYGQTISFNPYRSKQYELGVKTRVNEIDFSAAVFQITRPTYYEVNGIFGKQGDQRNRGIEFTTGGKIMDSLSAYGGITFIDPKMHKSANQKVVGKTIVGEPKVQANMLFDYAVPGTNKFAFTTNFHYTGKRYVDEMNTASVSGYFTTDLGARYTTKAWIGKETSIRFNVNNVFDKKYWVSIFSGDLDGSVPSSYSGASMFRGYGRTFMLSAQVKF